MIFTIIIFIITLLILVVLHELGHFLTAKKFGIKVEEFGFGIPPRAWGKKVGETLVSVNWLPFGGFVRLLGEDEADKTVLENKQSLLLHNKRSFAAQTVWKRLAVVGAGVAMNLVLAWVLFYIYLMFSGFQVEFPLIINHQFLAVQQTQNSQILVSNIAQGSPAQSAGLVAGERVMAVNGQILTSADELINKTKSLAGQKINLTIEDLGGTKMDVSLTPRQNPPQGQGAIGIVLSEVGVITLNYQTPMEKLLAGPIHSFNVTVYSGAILGDLISQSFKTHNIGPVSQTVSGPVGITSLVNTILTQEKNPLLPYLNFVAVLSLNLAIMNFLPFPALDGGRLFFLYIEAISKKKVNAELERTIHTVGMAILLLLMFLVTYSDIKKFF